MKKYKKGMLAFILSVAILCSIAPETMVHAATWDEINSTSVFLKQEGSSTCTLCAAAMLLRRSALLLGKGDWSNITESSLKSTAWISGTGLRWSFTYSGISIGHGNLPTGSANKNKLISLLDDHPEGIVIYYGPGQKQHAVLLTDYTNGTFYCADPYSGKPSGRIPLSSALYVTESNVSAYWYVTSPDIPGPVEYTTPPTNVILSKNQHWYDIQDTIILTPSADQATRFWMTITKDGNPVVSTSLDGAYSIPASSLGYGDYHAWMTAANDAGGTDSNGVDFSIVGEPTYTNIYSSKPVYDLDDNVSITVDSICAKGQVIGIDKEGVGRIFTGNTESTYTVAAKDMGVGRYSAYFSVYNGSGGVDTKRVSFEIADRMDLGTEFYARIKNVAVNKYLTNIEGNVEGENIDCDQSQIWLFRRLTDGSYKMVCSNDTSKAMNVTSYGEAGDGTNIQVYENRDVTSQKFYVYEAFGAYYLKPVCCNLFLDMQQNEPYNLEARIGQADLSTQKFEITKVNTEDVGKHKYDDGVITKQPTTSSEGEKTYTCTICKKTKTEPIAKLPDEQSGKLIVSATNGISTVGGTAEVFIQISNNPGIVGATFGVEYDKEKLQLLSCEDLGVLNDYQFSEISRNPFLMNWEDPLATQNNTSNGKIAKLSFKILNDLGEKGTELKLTVDTVYDINIEDVPFEISNAIIMSKAYKPGDVNGDGNVNSKDSILLRKYILGAEVTFNRQAADVNKDDKINSKDSILLRKYILGADTELK